MGSFRQSFPRNANTKRSRRKRHRALADTKNPRFFIGSGPDVMDRLVSDENSFDFSSSFVSVDVADSSVALPGSKRSLQGTAATSSSVSLTNCQPAVMNPNKAVLSLDHNGVVAVVNDVACLLLGYSCEELVGKTLDEIVSSVDLGTAVDQEDFETSKGLKGGSRIVVSGKVVRRMRTNRGDQPFLLDFILQVHVKRGDGERVPVSLWMRRSDGNRKIAVLEEVAVTTGEVRLLFWPVDLVES